jgi:hypothetical protein
VGGDVRDGEFGLGVFLHGFADGHVLFETIIWGMIFYE